jgi:hypothetical protein
LRHKAQDPALNPMLLDLDAQGTQEGTQNAPSSPDDMQDGSCVPPPFIPAIELTPMVHTTV